MKTERFVMDENVTHSRWESAGQVALALGSLGLGESVKHLILRVTLLQGQVPDKCP